MSYRMFDDPNYKPSDFIRERARLILRGQVEGLLETMLKELVKMLRK